MTAAEGARLEVKREAKRSWRDGKGIRGEAWAAVSAVGVGAGSYCPVLYCKSKGIVYEGRPQGQAGPGYVLYLYSR